MDRHAKLKEKFEGIESRLKDEDRSRLRRALSWLERAESTPASEPDERFLFFWIAFAAAYVGGRSQRRENDTEFSLSSSFLRRIASADRLCLLEQQLDYMSDSVKLLMDNPYVYDPFWSDRENWERSFTSSNRQLQNALRNRKAEQCIYLVLRRLHVLRNQIVHGGTTLRSSHNRKQVKDSAKIMSHLVPAILEIMLDHLSTYPDAGWGAIPYPRLSDRPNPPNPMPPASS